MTTSLRRLGAGFLIAFFLVAGTLGYWSMLVRDRLLAREDNPRLVLEEQRIRRGQILDRNGIVLAETIIDDKTGLAVRRYPYPDAAPVVGYYSLRYGVGGIEAEYDALLRGDASLTTLGRLTNEALHRPQVGGDVQLTLDLTIQHAADRALAGHRGAIVVLSVPTGEVLAMSSSPTFDANRLDETWDTLSKDSEASLLNRATQGLYQPGTILQSVILGAALNANLATLTEPWMGNPGVMIEDALLPCAGGPGQISDLSRAYQWACPAPFQALSSRLDPTIFREALSDFGLLNAPAFDLSTQAADLDTPIKESDQHLIAIGQGDLTVTPLQMVLVASAFANHGQMPAPYLVQAVRAPGQDWEAVTPVGHPRGTISRASADTVAELMARAVRTGAAQAARISGQTVYGHVGLAFSGPEHALNAWFIGFVYRRNEEAIAIAVLLEEATDARAAARMGGQVLLAGLSTSH